ncbi:MAG: DoxX family protein [Actinobacteria bacterium]|nr:DoxX family protein [Actinomycetota bacterium]
MDAVLVIGRVLFALIFVASGINHITKAEHMTGYAQFKKVPAAKASVILSGVLFLLAAASLILGVYADLGALVLAVLLVVMAVMFHNFWTQTDPQQKQMEQIAFFKNISMAGGALVMFAALAAQTEGARVIGPMMTNALFHK